MILWQTGPMQKTVDEVIGLNVAQVRQSHGLKLEDIAGSARAYGLRWNTARVSRIERGEGQLAASTLLMLSFLLTSLTSEDVTVERLLKYDGPISLAPDGTLKPGAIKLLLNGVGLAPREIFEEEAGLIGEAVDSLRGDYDDYNRILRPVGMTPGTAEAIDSGRRSWALSDERNAQKLGLRESEFLAWSIRLWGQLMSAETATRAGADSAPQRRGWVTRELMNQMREAIRDRGDD